MDYRILGRSGMRTGVIGLGTTKLLNTSSTVLGTLVQAALDKGVNLIDIPHGQAAFHKAIGTIIRGRRQKLLITGHFGFSDTSDHRDSAFDPARCEQSADSLLTHLKTEYVDFLVLNHSDTSEEGEQIFLDRLEAARKRQKQGKAHYIGFSSSVPALAQRAVETGAVDLLVFPINMPRHELAGMDELYTAVVRHNCALVATDILGDDSALVIDHAAGGVAQGISYALGRINVQCVIAQAENSAVLKEYLKFNSAKTTERDYTKPLTLYSKKPVAACVYCNQCLPCKANLDIGTITRMADCALYDTAHVVRKAYTALPHHASECSECGECIDRCPWKIDAIANMHRAALIFKR